MQLEGRKLKTIIKAKFTVEEFLLLDTVVLGMIKEYEHNMLEHNLKKNHPNITEEKIEDGEEYIKKVKELSLKFQTILPGLEFLKVFYDVAKPPSHLF